VVGPARHYRKLEAELAKAQRTRKKARVRALHAKIKNSRKDQLHKLSTALVQKYRAIFIGNVNASALARTRMAKSVLDAAGVCSGPCCNIRAITRACGSMSSMKRIQPRPVAIVTGAQVRRAWQDLE
jgi:hypothetical protein